MGRAPTGDAGPPKAAIVAACEDYARSWLEGDFDRMADCLHPALAKRTQCDARSGSLDLDESPYEAMVASAGRGPRPFSRELTIDVDLIRDGIASASVRSEPWLDLLHLARFDDRWRIVNVLYEPRASAVGEPGDRDAISGVLDAYAAAGFDDDLDAVLRTHHPALAERRVITDAGGRRALQESDLPEVIEAVRAGLDMGRFARTWEARILDLGRDIASARVVAGWYDVDLHLARFGPRWLIVNVLCRVLEPPA